VRVLLRSAVLLLGCFGVLSPVLAQGEGQAQDEGEQPAQPQLTPPEILEFVEADYPEAAEAEGLEATVELEITIAADGVVTDARVVTPVGNGFDEAALDAVRRFTFRPATRDGEPIPARIRYNYVFELRAPEPPPDTPPDVPPPPSPGRLEGRILGQEDGNPIERAEVILVSEDQSIARRAVTGEDGSFRIDDLPPGTYALRILADEYGEMEQTEEVRSDEVTDVTYRMAILEAPEDIGFGAEAVIDPPPREVVRRTITREELTRIPGTRGDALRALELLPGVARPPFGSGNLIIRGSAPGDSQVFVEGVPVPLLYHFGGLTSIINSRLLSRIDFFPGNYSARYGRKLGGIIEVGLREGETDGLGGVAEFGVIDASLLAEFPIGENANGAFSFRRSLIDVVLNGVIPDDSDINITAAPVYYDFQGFITWRPTDRDRLRFFAYGASDRFALVADDSLGEDPAVRGDVSLTTRFTVLDVDYQRQLNDRTDLDLMVSWSPTVLEFGVGDLITFDLTVQQLYGRAEIRHRPNDDVRIIAGADLNFSPFDITYQGPTVGQTEGSTNQGSLGANRDNITTVSRTATSQRPAFYFESDMQLADPLKVVMGLRVDYAGEIDRFSFDPRMLAIVSITDEFRLKMGAGIFSQPPEFQESAPVIGNPDLDYIHSVHTGLGFEYDIGEGMRVGVDGFYKYLWDRVVATEGNVAPFYTNEGIGRIYGAEISGRVNPLRGRRFFGFLSYTLMRSERRDRPGEDFRLFDFDQTHIFTLAGVYKLPKNWEIGLTLRIVSGNPNTPVIGSVYDARSDTYFPINGEVNSTRNPVFHRLDFRIEKKWVFESWRLALFLDIQNVYNQQNQEGIIYNYDYTESVPISGLPIIPALGIRGEL